MYWVDGRPYDADEPKLQQALAAAYEKHLRPLCSCAEPPAPFYVARLGSTFVLKRMPFTGSRHAIDCCHYDAPIQMSGLDEILGTAVSEDPDTGVTNLRVDFSLIKGAPHAVPSAGQAKYGVVRSDGAHLTLRGLVLLLWRDAELTKWRPGFEGKRNWAVVRSHLLRAASNKVLKGFALLDALYVPEAFTVANAESIRTRRQALFDRGLRASRHSAKRMILIGELKETLPARFHFNVVVKHIPDAPYLMTGDLHRKMLGHFEGELALWAGNPESHLVVAATFSLTDWGQPLIDELCLVPMSAHWIPTDDGFEKRLIDKLVRERRTFDKTLGFNSRQATCSISAVLLDTPSSPTPLRLDRREDDEPSARPAFDSEDIGWQWQVHGSGMPALPT